MDQVLRTGEKQEIRLFHKISRIEHNKLIIFLILMISVDFEKNLNIFPYVCTGNDSFIFIIANQKFCWTSRNIEILQLDLR